MKQERSCHDEQANRTRDAQESVFGGGTQGKLATHSLRKSFAQRLYEESDDIYTLFLELALRGYALSSLLDNETTGEILKIS